MFSLVCVLHSSDGIYRDELLAQAVTCTSTVFTSIASASPDFIPQLAVIRADPHAGAQYLYSTTVPDSIHGVEAVRMFAAPYSASLMQADGPTGSISPTDGGVAFAPVFRARSAQWLQECIMAGTRASVSAKPVKGSQAVSPWGSLAGGLLTALAFLQKQQDRVGNAVGEEGPSPSSLSVRPRQVIVVFSDADDASPLLFTAECAMAMLAQLAVRRGTRLFCYGRAVSPMTEEGGGRKKDPYSPGGCRLRSLCASTGGASHPEFRHSFVGALMEASAGSELQRPRLVDQYVFNPTMLPLQADGKEVDVAANQLGWLCPDCMAIVRRQTGGSEEWKYCPYCDG